MNNIRSFANNPRVVNEENPNRARMKKKTPTLKRSEKDTRKKKKIHTKAILEATDGVGNVVIKQSTKDCESYQVLPRTPMKVTRTCESNRRNVVRCQKGRVPVQVLECPST